MKILTKDKDGEVEGITNDNGKEICYILLLRPLVLVEGKEIGEEGANSKLENQGETSNIL